jgi:DNA modification methylase
MMKFIPESILKHDKRDKAIDLSIERGRSYSAVREKRWKRAGKKHSYDLTRKEPLMESPLINRRLMAGRSAMSMSGVSVRSGALSRFSQNVGRIITNRYAPKGCTVYDPFAGHNSRMQLVWKTGRNYIGVDVSHEFMKANRKIKKMLLYWNKYALIKIKATIKLIEGSSDKVDLPSNSCDFTITSPPYWDIEYYGPEKEQLGMNKNYEGFLKAISKHIKENYRVLKPGAFCCWFVSDFRKCGKFYSYEGHIARVFKDAGFEIFDECIVDLGSSIGQIFAEKILKTKILPKRHEYCLVFRKPEKNPEKK